ncbi:hypothetical protein ACHAPT_012189 [Fusarium lateritium]
MPPSGSPRSRLRKHTKTFSGCWTCRARKVKCDEARPQCHQCRRKGTRCEGYGVKLQWVNDNDSHAEITLLSPRSAIPPDPHRAVLPYGRVDQILNTLDSTGSRRQAPRNVSLFIECFGVFGDIHKRPLVPPQGDNIPINSDSPFEPDITEQNVDLAALLDSVQGPLMMPSWDPFSPDILGNDQDLLFDPSVTPHSVHDNTSCTYSNGPLATIDAERHDSTQLQAGYLTTISFIHSPAPSHLSSNERFLMYHYSKRALYIFCVVDHDKSPWKTIHLPKALQAAGELSVQGTTSGIRNALTNTLLAISAFLLCNDNESQLLTDEAFAWRTAADRYRHKAKKLLKDAVENDFCSKTRPKYKDFLATTLSMITMNASLDQMAIILYLTVDR